MPQLLIGLRITLGIAWLVVVAAEMIAVDSGLGFLIVDARNAGNRYDLVVAGMVIIGVIGLLLDTAMHSLEGVKSFRWAYSKDYDVAEPIAIAPRTAAAKFQAEHVRMTFTRDGKSTPVLETSPLTFQRASSFAWWGLRVVASPHC